MATLGTYPSSGTGDAPFWINATGTGTGTVQQVFDLYQEALNQQIQQQQEALIEALSRAHGPSHNPLIDLASKALPPPDPRPTLGEFLGDLWT